MVSGEGILLKKGSCMIVFELIWRLGFAGILSGLPLLSWDYEIFGFFPASPVALFTIVPEMATKEYRSTCNGRRLKKASFI